MKRCISIFFLITLCEGGNILVFPSPFNADRAERLVEFADALVAKSHHVTVWLPQIGQTAIASPKTATLRSFKLGLEVDPDGFMRSLKIPGNLETVLEKQPEEIQRLLSEEWDAVVADDLDGILGLVVSDLKKSPLILFAPDYLSELTALGVGSFFPSSSLPVASASYDDDMSVWERYKNSVQFGVRLSTFWAVNKYWDSILRRHIHQPLRSLAEIRETADFTFVDFPKFLDYPRPGRPNIIDLGGLECASKDSVAVPPEIIGRIDKSKGLIVVTIGSQPHEELRTDEVETMLRVFNGFKDQLFLWYDPNKPAGNLSHNILLTSDLDVATSLMSHKRTKALIANGSKKTIKAAICNGLPLVGVPMDGIQAGNIARITRKKAAILVDRSELRIESQLSETVKQIQSEALLRHNMANLKEALEEDVQTPLDTALFWTEYTVRHQGAGPLNPPLPPHSFVSYYMVDFKLAAMVAVYVFWRVCSSVVGGMVWGKNKIKTD